ncbi:hypothetical protein HDU82_001318 [Entophlyctis luteolus]|nr:hypothetical protein HDU82_001318 [Entophlyctis luteolus]
MDREEVDAYITGLEEQLAEMKRIVFGDDLKGSGGADMPSAIVSSPVSKELEALRTENQKLAYRVNMLLSTVSEKRARIAQLEEQ